MKEEERKEKEEKAQHRAFPRGPPPQYYPSQIQLNCAVRMGSGVSWIVWPHVTIKVANQ